MKKLIVIMLFAFISPAIMAQTFGDISKNLTKKIHKAVPREKVENFTRKAIHRVTSDPDFQKAFSDTLNNNNLDENDISELSEDEMDEFESDFAENYNEHMKSKIYHSNEND